MFKKLLLSAFMLLAGTAANAGFIQCLPGQGTVVDNAGGTSVIYNCNPGAGNGPGLGGADDNLFGDGWDVTAIRLRVSGTFQENSSPVVGQSYSVLFSTANGQGYNNTNCTAFGVANGSNQALGNCVGTGASFALASATDVINSFQVTVTGAPGSIPLPFNASASLFYEVIATQPTTVPEPAGLALVALALLGLGLARRRA